MFFPANLKEIVMSEIVVRFVRESDGNQKADGTPSAGRPVGVVVAISEQEVGVAFWSSKSRGGNFDKNFLKNLAAGRAIMQDYAKIPDREIELAKVPGVFVSLRDCVDGEVRKAIERVKRNDWKETF